MSGGYAVKGGARGGCPNLHGAEGGGRLGGAADAAEPLGARDTLDGVGAASPPKNTLLCRRPQATSTRQGRAGCEAVTRARPGGPSEGEPGGARPRKGRRPNRRPWRMG